MHSPELSLIEGCTYRAARGRTRADSLDAGDFPRPGVPLLLGLDRPQWLRWEISTHCSGLLQHATPLRRSGARAGGRNGAGVVLRLAGDGGGEYKISSTFAGRTDPPGDMGRAHLLPTAVAERLAVSGVP
jgi:hypothetical protein